VSFVVFVSFVLNSQARNSNAGNDVPPFDYDRRVKLEFHGNRIHTGMPVQDVVTTGLSWDCETTDMQGRPCRYEQIAWPAWNNDAVLAVVKVTGAALRCEQAAREQPGAFECAARPWCRVAAKGERHDAKTDSSR
jgi:hypothetical protein